MASTVASYTPFADDFAAMLDESFAGGNLQESSVIKGKVVAIEKDMAVIDVGLKTEGRVALREFAGPGRESDLKVGDEVEAFSDRIENALGEAVLSRDKARREESWGKLEKAFNNNEKVHGVIFNQVKGGFTVDLDGAVAFLPRSQVDIRPIRDVAPLMNNSQPFQILKMDRRRGNIVVSRRTVLEETRAEQRQELVQNLQEGQVIDRGLVARRRPTGGRRVYAQAVRSRSAQRPPAEHLEDWPRARLLVVEDDVETRDCVCRSLREQNWEVYAAGDGLEAFWPFGQHRPDLILLDLMLPVMHGLEVIEEVGKDPELHSIPIVVMTAADLGVEDRQHLERQVKQILHKGLYGRDELLREIRTLVREHQRRTSPPVSEKVHGQILYIEDEPEIAELVRRWLEEDDEHRVLECAEWRNRAGTGPAPGPPRPDPAGPQPRPVQHRRLGSQSPAQGRPPHADHPRDRPDGPCPPRRASRSLARRGIRPAHQQAFRLRHTHRSDPEPRSFKEGVK